MSLGLLLTIVFFVAKVAELGDFATWSWWLVFLPLIIEVVVDLILLVFRGSVVRSLFKH